MLTTQDFLAKRRARSYELIRHYNLTIEHTDVAHDDDLERAVAVEMLHKLLTTQKVGP